MGILTDFLEVIKELKHKKRNEPTNKLCPKCQSLKISITNVSDTYPRLFGITPEHYVCLNCGYKGTLVLEQIIEKDESV